MTTLEQNKQVIRDSIQKVWVENDLTALPKYWTENCLNHVMGAETEAGNRGLEALRTYHEQIMEEFAAFTDVRLEILQQIAEGERVVTQIKMTGEHSGTFAGIPATGRRVSLVTIRIDRLEEGKIAEHESVADVMGLMQQLQAD